MKIGDMLKSPDTKLIYDNYNAVYLYKSDIIIKQYKDAWRLKNECDVNLALKQIGFPYIQNIIEISPPYVVFNFIAEQTFGQRVRKTTISILELLHSTNLLSINAPINLSHNNSGQNMNDIKDRILGHVQELFDNNLLNLKEVDAVNEIVSSYKFSTPRFIHGDLRPDNIIGNSGVKCFIDWEHAEYGDLNRDLAYLYFGISSQNSIYIPELLKEIERLNGFTGNSFNFFMLHIYSACMANPKENKMTWAENLWNFIKLRIV
jgi:thiamine kinase-like enzyme